MLAELLASACIAIGSMAAKTMAPPKVGVIASKDKLACGRMAELLASIASRLREASRPDDVPWRERDGAPSSRSSQPAADAG